MESYKEYIPKANEDWWGKYESLIGAKELLRYKHHVYLTIFKLKKGSCYRIDNIPEDRRELFVKISCQFFLDFCDRKKSDPSFMPDDFFDFDASITMIKHI